MENLLNYVRLRRDIDFSVRPFNEVDMLVCADLSYVDWDTLYLLIKVLRYGPMR